MKSLLTLALLLVLALPAGAADVTYYRDVAPILQENCESCHRPLAQNLGGMFAPMSLQSYDEVRPWAKSIAREVQNREMPPWFATEHTRGQFHDERVLSEDQITTVVDWVRLGAPAGDPSEAPAPATRTEDQTAGWSVGEPDLIVHLPEPYFVEDDIPNIGIQLQRPAHRRTAGRGHLDPGLRVPGRRPQRAPHVRQRLRTGRTP